MAFGDDYDFELLVNEAEHMVVEELERQLEQPENRDLRRSHDAVLDIAAFALNAVPASYRVNLMGRLYAEELDRKHGETVRTAVARAIEVVRANPPA
ncbi:MAG: competence protein ComFB [Spirochaetaceae bacterium]|nr:MAG: competence protein ComFB [Spirochaetaceae bacterium]